MHIRAQRGGGEAARRTREGDREGGRVLSTEILLPRIARQGAVCLISII